MGAILPRWISGGGKGQDLFPQAVTPPLRFLQSAPASLTAGGVLCFLSDERAHPLRHRGLPGGHRPGLHLRRPPPPGPPSEALLDLASLREPRPLAGFTPRGVDTLDGVKWLYEEAWVLFRASGTEPVVRVYVEATSPGLVQALLEEARKPVEE